MLVERLTLSGQFLALSRTEPQLFNQPTEFVLANGVIVNITSPGIIQFTPVGSSRKDIVLSCGVHGNETAPIEICDDLVSQILRLELNPQHRLLVIFANLPSMDIEKRFVEENLNRLFSGAHATSAGGNNVERQRAKELEQVVADFYTQGGSASERLHYDLHTAIRASKNDKFAVYPFLHGKQHSLEQLAFLYACGVNTFLLSESPTTTFSYYSSHQFGAHGFTVELGKVQRFGENDMSKFVAVRKTLTDLIVKKELKLPEFSPRKCFIYRVNQVINKHQADFKLHFDTDTPNFTDFEKGYLLASETGAEYRCEFDNEAIVFPNENVAIGQRALLTVVATKI
ncbi:succinylglutamate desuccinylase [Aliiglaciecola sp. 3_MG-2023]|uniref:succinylglutamate desuccinylase n=1 Tax=Aliiglaciecola sp. 3_MG-2023 TaxID=3062644 RepID=UPI0026E38BED|nr:succinylglutamate desuccinylase [Aliiglaciecola sp. 3_MG-2023]MDO6695546.1 succinylglutamate desuccinylase [Aliiglaciecola sp. 3_MG-2023]